MKKFWLKLIALSFILTASVLITACASNGGGHVHSYTERVIGPTCTEQGYTLHECDCKDSYKDNFVGKLEHSFTNYSYNNDAKCEVNGTETAYCDNGCGQTDVKVVQNSALSHRFVNYLPNGDGTKTASCENGCGKTHTIDQAHEHDYTQTVVGPTCTAQGYTLHECNCGDSYKDDYQPKLDHSFTNYISDNNATCTANGTKTAKCDRCEEKDTQEDLGSALDHSFTNYISDNNATCTANGTKTAKCDRCEEIDTQEDLGSALDHSFTNYVYNNDAKCEVNGTKTAKCDNGCGETDNKIVEGTALSHVYTDYVSNGDGTKTASCDNGCGKTDTIAEEINWESVFTVNQTGETIVGFTEYGRTLTSIVIPEKINGVTITAIGNISCTSSNLEQVYIGKNVTHVGHDVFYMCSNLKSIEISEDNEYYKSVNGDVYTKDGKTLVRYAIGKKDTAFSIIDGVETIGQGACYNGINLKEIVVPDSVVTIERDAFGTCWGIESVVIGDSVTSIGESAFGIGNVLKKVTIGRSVTSIHTNAFVGCYRLAEIYNKSNLNIVAGTTTYGSLSAYAIKVYKTDEPSKVSVDQDGFVVYDDGTEKILIDYVGEKTNLVIKDGITKINTGALYGKDQLISVEIPDSVTEIKYLGFGWSSSLQKVIIPSTVSTIGKSVFTYCNNLTIYCEASSKPDGWDTNWNPDPRPVEWGYGEQDVDWSAVFVRTNGFIEGLTEYGKTLTSITVPEKIDGVTITNVDQNAFSYADNLEHVVIGDSVTTVWTSAFFNCYNLKSVVIGSGVTSIYAQSFVDARSLTSIEVSENNLNFKSVDGNLYSKDGKRLIRYANGKTQTTHTIMAGVTTIDDYAFDMARYLEKVVIGGDVTTIGNYAFSYCPELSEVVFGDSVTTIGENAFNGYNKLTKLTIGKNVQTIKSMAFYLCSKLTEINFDGTVEKWNAIDKGIWWNMDVPATVVHCTNGDASL